MKRLVSVVALAVSLSAWAQAPQSKDQQQKAKSQPGTVNWEGQVIKATGAGAPDMRSTNPAQARLGAERAAKMDAFRQLIEQAKGIKVTTDKSVGDALAQEQLRGKVEGVIRAYRITDKRYFSDSGVEIDVEVPLAAISALLAPDTGAKIAINEEGEPTNSGLVIDARGLKVVPALSPRVLDEDGNPVYASDCLTDEARKSQAVASYFKSLDEATRSKLVGAKALVVKAVSANGADLVIPADVARQLTSGNNRFLAEGRVAIVTN